MSGRNGRASDVTKVKVFCRGGVSRSFAEETAILQRREQWEAREGQSTPDLARRQNISPTPWLDRIMPTFCMVLLRKSLRTISVMSGLVLPMYSSLRDGTQVMREKYAQVSPTLKQTHGVRQSELVFMMCAGSSSAPSKEQESNRFPHVRAFRIAPNLSTWASSRKKNNSPNKEPP